MLDHIVTSFEQKDQEDLYQTVMELHTTNFNMEDYNKMKNKQKHRIKIIATTSSVCIILAASTTAYAMNMFGMKDIGSQIHKNNPLMTTKENTSAKNLTAEPSVPLEDVISLQGFADSNECKAVNEWNRFTSNYDQDGALLKKAGTGSTGMGVDSKYDLYFVYTQEMADKLDEIVKKYNLTLHTTLNIDITTEELIHKVASGNFLGTANTNKGAYMYEDGTFHIDGCANLASGLKIDYLLSNYKKGTFNDVVLNIGNKNDYDEWSYKTACGINVHLAISPENSLIIADLGDSYMTIKVLAGTASGFLEEKGKITSFNLEELANSFDFSLIK